MTFSKEQLITRAIFLIKRYEDSLANYPDQDGVAMDFELARMALAGMEAEPVGVTDKSEIECLKRGEMANVMPPYYKGCDSGDSVYLYTAPQPLTTSERAELENYRNDVPEDYFASLVTAARIRADKAMLKFPQPNYVLNKVAEESGEVIKAVIHFTEGREQWTNVEAELIDNLAMLIRLVKEGDQVIGFTPPEVCRSAMQSAAVKDGWVMVPVEPTEDMIIAGFEAELREEFRDPEAYEAFEAMSGCAQGALQTKWCWAAMLAASPACKEVYRQG